MCRLRKSRIAELSSGVMPTTVVLAYTLVISFLVVSNLPTYSGKLVGQRVAREYVLPVFVLVALFVAVLLTYPYITLTIGCLVYLLTIPVSVYTYREDQAKATETAKAQNGASKKTQEEEVRAPQSP